MPDSREVPIPVDALYAKPRLLVGAQRFDRRDQRLRKSELRPWSSLDDYALLAAEAKTAENRQERGGGGKGDRERGGEREAEVKGRGVHDERVLS